MAGNRVALITGSGFSVAAGLPVTSKLNESFLESPENGVLPAEMDHRITSILRQFWQDVFGYAQGELPSFEDHFTLLDLSANEGHNLGSSYSPRKLRAIRRFSIHRVFDVLDQRYHESDEIHALLDGLERVDPAFGVITLNWDIVIEKHLRNPFRYAGNLRRYRDAMGGGGSHPRQVFVHKMHGSASWGYCDTCRGWFYGEVTGGKFCLHKKILIEKRDFEPFDECVCEGVLSDKGTCPECHKPLSTRLGTFSFRKDLAQFQTVWDSALQSLRNTDTWLFIGYSLPEADYEFKHLLKTAQLAHNNQDNLHFEVVLKDDPEAEDRYKTLFGTALGGVWQRGLETWVRHRLDDFIGDLNAQE